MPHRQPSYNSSPQARPEPLVSGGLGQWAPRPVDTSPEHVERSLARVRECLKAGDYLSAIALAQPLTAAHPHHPFGWLMLTEAQRGLGDQAAALGSARRLANCAADQAWAHQLHALLAKRQGDYQEAEAAYQCALELTPEDAEAHCNLAAVLSARGRHDEALVHLRHALALKPDFAEAQTNLGAILVTQGRDQEGLAAHQRAVELNPQSAIAHDNLGLAYSKLGQYPAARQAHRQAIQLAPGLASAHAHLGDLFIESGAFDEAEVALRQALRFDPKHQAARDRLLSLQGYLGTTPPTELRRESEHWEIALLTPTQRRAAREHCFQRDARAGRKLRIGILSAEFGEHPVAYFLLPWLKQMDRSRFELCFYSTNSRADQRANAQFRALADHWRDVSVLTDAEALKQLRADRLDLLLETSGHTSHNRLGIVARRAAPVQCHYIGYFATTGLSEMDYVIADEVLIPTQHDHHFTERVWRCPRSRYVYQPLDKAPEPVWKPSPDGCVRIGSFNDPIKVRGPSLKLWARVLHALPNARLILKNRREEDQASRDRILATLGRLGIGPERVEFVRHQASWFDHMALYNDIDVALDSVPFNSATTAFDALWMGAPLVTLLGDRLAGRQAASCLTGLGRREWIAEDADRYVEKVLELARNPGKRRQIRETQREQMRNSELCDSAGMARVLENSFDAMFDRWLELEATTLESGRAHAA